jgi:hypothetical protein
MMVGVPQWIEIPTFVRSTKIGLGFAESLKWDRMSVGKNLTSLGSNNSVSRISSRFKVISIVIILNCWLSLNHLVVV